MSLTSYSMQFTEACRRMEWMGVSPNYINQYKQQKFPLFFHQGHCYDLSSNKTLREVVDKLSKKIQGIVYAIILYPEGDKDKCAFLVVRGNNVWWNLERGTRYISSYETKFTTALYEYSNKSKAFFYVCRNIKSQQNTLYY